MDGAGQATAAAAAPADPLPAPALPPQRGRPGAAPRGRGLSREATVVIGKRICRCGMAYGTYSFLRLVSGKGRAARSWR